MTAPGIAPGHGPAGPPTASQRPLPPTRSAGRSLLVVVIVAVVLGGGIGAYLLSSPSYDLSTARGAAQAFSQAVRDRDVAGLKEIVCSEDRYRVDRLSSQLMGIEGIELTVSDVTEKGDSGTATVSVPGLGVSQKLDLERDDSSGLWTVCIPDGLR